MEEDDRAEETPAPSDQHSQEEELDAVKRQISQLPVNSDSIPQFILLTGTLPKRLRRALDIPSPVGNFYPPQQVAQIETEWQPQDSVNLDIGVLHHRPTVQFKSDPTRTLYISRFGLPGAVTFVEFSFQTEVGPPSQQAKIAKWQIGIEALRTPTENLPVHSAKNLNTSAVIGATIDEARYQANGALIHHNVGTRRQDPWAFIKTTSTTSESYRAIVAFELDLRVDHVHTLRFFQNQIEQRKCFYDLPLCAYRFSARLGDTHSLLVQTRFEVLPTPTRMQPLEFSEFQEW